MWYDLSSRVVQSLRNSSGSHDVLANESKLEFQGSSQTRFKVSYNCHKWNNANYLCLLLYVNKISWKKYSSFVSVYFFFFTVYTQKTQFVRDPIVVRYLK